MVKKFRVVTIALLGANNAMKKNGDIVTKEELTGSIDELLEEGFIEEVIESNETVEEVVEPEVETEEVTTEENEVTETTVTDEEVIEEVVETTETENQETVEEVVEPEVETTTEIPANPLVDKLKNNRKK